MNLLAAFLALSALGGGRDFYPREYCATAGIDLNHDGIDDLVIGLNGYEVSPDKVIVRDAGRVFVLSGKDGKVLLEMHGDHDGDLFGAWVTPAGDVNGDGVPDLWIGMPGGAKSFSDPATSKSPRAGGGGVRLCSGKDGAVLRELQWKEPCIDAGGGVWTIQDLDGDGVRDLIVASQSHKQLFATSSVTGKVLWAIATDVWVHGDHVAMVGDIDGDGVSDLVLGWMAVDVDEKAEGHPWRGRIDIVSGRTGKDITAFRGIELLPDGWSFTGEVAAVEDAKGTRLVLARCYEHPKNRNRRTAVHLLSIKDHSWKGPLQIKDVEGKATLGSDQSDSIGTSMTCLGDIDGDGRADFAISAPYWQFLELRGHGLVHVYSGKSLTVQNVIVPRSPPEDCECFGDQVGSIGDVNGDGVRDVFVISWPCEDCSGNTGSKLDVYSGKTCEPLWHIDLEPLIHPPKPK